MTWSVLTPLQPRSQATGELQGTAIAARVFYWIKIYQSSLILNHLTRSYFHMYWPRCMGGEVIGGAPEMARFCMGKLAKLPMLSFQGGWRNRSYAWCNLPRTAPAISWSLRSHKYATKASRIVRLSMWLTVTVYFSYLVIKYSNKHDCSPSKKKLICCGCVYQPPQAYSSRWEHCLR